MKKEIIYILFLVVGFTYGQDYNELIAKGTYTVDYISQVAEQHFDSIGRGRGTGYKPFKRWQYIAQREADENGYLKSPEFYYNTLQNYNAQINSEGVSSRTVVGDWEEMGPTYWNATSGWNPGVGRITALDIEVNNPNHIIVGGQTGGVWRSIDGGTTWEVLTDNLSNIDVYALAIDPTNASTYYWGSTSGNIFKSTDSGATWVLHGALPSGNVNKILIHPTNSLIMFATAEGGGIYKSTDGGFNWIIIHASATNGYDIEFKPGNLNTIYATGNNYYISNDGGQTFNIPNGLSQWSQDIVSGNNSWTTTASNQNNTVSPRAGNAMALFYINNFSSPETRLISPPLNLSGAQNPELKFSFTNVSWASDTDALKVLYKTSANGSWTELANYTTQNVFWNDVTLSLPNTNSTYYIAFEGKANYGRGLTLDEISVETSNNGVVFNEGFENSPNQFSSGPKMIGVSSANPNVVYVLEANGGVFGGLHKSVDSGLNFSLLPHTKNYFGYDTNGNDNLGQAPRDMDIAVHPDDENDVHIAGINTWRSTDGGASFTITSQWTPSNASNLNIGYCHADVDILKFHGSGASATLYAGTDGGIFKADNPTNVTSSYYTDLTPGLGIRQFYKIGVSQTDPVIVTGGSQDNGTSALRADGNWVDWLGADGMESFVDKNNPQVMYGTSQFGSLYKTTNGGNSRFGLTNPAGNGSWNWIVPFEQDPIDVNTVYVAYKSIYKSTNGGTSFTSISPSYSGNIDHFKVAPSNNQNMYFSINDSFFSTNNGGVTWVQSSGLTIGSASINSIAVHPTNSLKVAVAVGNNDKVYVTSNGGSTWVPIGWDLPNFSALSLAWHNDGADGLYVGMNYGVYFTENAFISSTGSWSPFNNGLPNVRVSELEINNADGKLYAGTYGRGLWRTNVYNPLSTKSFTLQNFTLYPNPAKNRVSIKTSSALGDVQVRVFNTQGKLMLFDLSANLDKSITLDVSKLLKGVYFVKINSNLGEFTKKLIVE